MLIGDTQTKELYEDFIQKSLTYVVSTVKFLSYAIHDDILRPDYLPYRHVVGFHKLYEPSIGEVARVDKMKEENGHRFVLSRAKKGLSLHAVDAYREIFDGNHRRDCDHKIIPVHFALRTHFDPTREKYYHPLSTISTMRYFINQHHSTDIPHADRKKQRMIFYAETFGDQVNMRCRHKGLDLEPFNQTVTENCEAITAMTAAYNTVAACMEKYVIQ